MQIRLCVGLVVVAGLLGSSVLRAGGGFSCMRAEARIAPQISYSAGPQVGIVAGNNSTINLAINEAAPRTSERLAAARSRRDIAGVRVTQAASGLPLLRATLSNIAQQAKKRHRLDALAYVEHICVEKAHPDLLECPPSLTPALFERIKAVYGVMYSHFGILGSLSEDHEQAQRVVAAFKGKS